MLPGNLAPKSRKFITHRSLLIADESPLPHPPSYSESYSEDCSGGNPEGYLPGYLEGNSGVNPDGYRAGYSPRNPESSRGDCPDSNSAGRSGNRRENCPESNSESYPESNSKDCLPGYSEDYSGNFDPRPFCCKAAGAQLLQLDNLTDGLCLSLRLGLFGQDDLADGGGRSSVFCLRSSDEVHPRRQYAQEQSRLHRIDASHRLAQV
jgi:hypothetical protein